MQMDAGLDTGPVIAARSIAIDRADTTGSLTQRLAMLAAGLAVEAIPAYVDGSIRASPQVSANASLTRPLVKSDGWIDWSSSAQHIERQVRAMIPWPRAWTTIAAEPMQILSACVAEKPINAGPGEVLASRGELRVACGVGALLLDTVQPAGGRPMAGSALQSGRRLAIGEVLGQEGRPPAPPPFILDVSSR
jgi:methionyl-tRNA formyltransferase